MNKQSKQFLLGFTFVCLNTFICASNARQPDSLRLQEFDRTQYMLMNLNRGEDSSAAHIKEAMRQAHIAITQLDKALHQIEQVDKAYAKTRGKPDERYLGGVETHISACRATALHLEEDCHSAEEELKESIHQVLLLDKSNN